MAAKTHKRKFMTPMECDSKFRKLDNPSSSSSSSSSSTTSTANNNDFVCCCPWLRSLWRKLSQVTKNKIPKDVPKGHMVVYVGQNLRRFVIKITLLDHPLFRSLLDEARDEYGFAATSKLCIPCDENMFLDVICCANSHQGRWIGFCL